MADSTNSGEGAIWINPKTGEEKQVQVHSRYRSVSGHRYAFISNVGAEGSWPVKLVNLRDTGGST